MKEEETNMVANSLMQIVGYFNKHPNSQNMTYLQHFKRSFRFSMKMCIGFVCLLIHSVFPFLFESTGSNIINELYNEVKKKESS